MSEKKEIGTIAELNRTVYFEWEIRDFFSYTEQNSRYYSPPFPVLDSTWQIEFWPNFISNDNSISYVSLYLSKINNKIPKNVHLTLFIKTATGTYENKKEKSCTFTDQGLGWAQFIDRNQLQTYKGKFVPSGTLTIICSLIIKTCEQDFIASKYKICVFQNDYS